MLYTVGIAFSRVTNFLLLPLYLASLATEEYGALGLVESVVRILVLVAMMGTPQAVIKLGVDLADDPEKRRRLAATSMSWAGLAGIGLGGLMAIAWPYLTPYIGGVPLWPVAAAGLCGVAGAAMFQVAVADIQGRRKSTQHTVYSAAQSCLLILFVVPLLTILKLGPSAILLATAISFAVATVLVAMKTKHRLSPTLDRPLLRQALQFGIPLLPYYLAAVVLQTTDRFMLASFATDGLTAVGVYAFGAKLGSALTMVGVGFQRAWLPFFMEEQSRGAGKDWRRVRAFSLRSIIVLGALACVMALTAPELTRVLAPEEYAGGAVVAGVIAFAAVLSAWSQMCVSVLMGEQRTSRMIWWFTVPVAILNIGLNLWLVPIHGALGAAWATVAAMAVNALLTSFAAVKLKGVPLNVVLAGVVAVVCFGVVWFGASLGVFSRYGLALAVVVGVAVVALRMRAQKDNAGDSKIG
ncbi:lipopolysaccharide biosynthesis protein [Planctomycetota bacterium]